MPYKKGESGNPSGRVKGSKNKTPEQIRSALLKFIQDNIDAVSNDFKELDTKQRLDFFEKIIRHVLPPPTSLEQLSEQQLEQLHTYLLKKFSNDEAEEN